MEQKTLLTNSIIKKNRHILVKICDKLDICSVLPHFIIGAVLKTALKFEFLIKHGDIPSIFRAIFLIKI